jgi:sterol desaturase/sphingolipid hydroxylase (fatty acid hydroxylase superfamily)
LDLTIMAIPGFFGSMGYEAWWLKRRAEREGPSLVDYEWHDTLASLSMGVGNLIIPVATKRLSRNFELCRGRWARPMIGVAGAAALTAVVADAIARAGDQEAGQLPGSALADVTSTEAGGSDGTGTTGAAGAVVDTTAAPAPGRRARRWARRIGGSAATAAIAATGITAASTWAARTTGRRLFDKRVGPDLGGGPLALAVAVLGWDFIYYWNHRLQHESRFLWAIHVVHHSSEKYNLSTALRQPWAESLGVFVPYGLLSLLGVRPHMIDTARELNLLYQYWIHTDAIGKLGRWESVLNSPSHHRAHHGANKRYLDRNHGSILIVWDRLFGTFEPESDADPVKYGLTKNIETYNPLRIATHEYVDIARDVAESTTWRDRLSFVLRGPGWAYSRHPERPGGEAPPAPTPTVDAA